MYIYGSYALKHWFPDWDGPVKDIDVILLDQDAWDDDFAATLDQTMLFEVKVAPWFEHLAHLTQDGFFTPEGLLTNKMAHAHIDEHWIKCMRQIEFLQSKGVGYDRDALLAMRRVWNEIHAGKRQPMDFNKTPDEFFNSQVERFVDHDELHDALRIGDVPAFTRILANDTTVEVSRDKFEALPYEQQLHTVIEEVAVLGVERYFHVKDPRDAYRKALRDFCTRMTNGWYNIFLLENYSKILHYNETNIYEIMYKIMLYVHDKNAKARLIDNHDKD